MKYGGYRFSTVWLNGGKFLRVWYVGDGAIAFKQRSLPAGCSNKRRKLRPHMDSLLALVMLEK